MPSARPLPAIQPEISIAERPVYLRGLNGIRAFAVLAVVFHHAHTWDENTLAGTFAYNGKFGVDAFFVLSGFLITKMLLEEEKRRGVVSLAKFYLRRAIRILPPAFAF